MTELAVPSGGDFRRGGEEVSEKSRSAFRSVVKIMDWQRSKTVDMYIQLNTCQHIPCTSNPFQHDISYISLCIYPYACCFWVTIKKHPSFAWRYHPFTCHPQLKYCHWRRGSGSYHCKQYAKAIFKYVTARGLRGKWGGNRKRHAPSSTPCLVMPWVIWSFGAWFCPWSFLQMSKKPWCQVFNTQKNTVQYLFLDARNHHSLRVLQL